MAGMFELFVDAESAFRFRLTAPDDTIMAVSKPFHTKTDAVAGIAAVREYAGMGLIADHSTTATDATSSRTYDDPAGQSADSPRVPKIDFTRAPEPLAEPSPVPAGLEPYTTSPERRAVSLTPASRQLHIRSAIGFAVPPGSQSR